MQLACGTLTDDFLPGTSNCTCTKPCTAVYTVEGEQGELMKKAVVLLSGGLDSTTCLAMAKAAGFEPVCLAVAYGQRHAVELERARKVARPMGVKDFRVVTHGPAAASAARR